MNRSFERAMPLVVFAALAVLMLGCGGGDESCPDVQFDVNNCGVCGHVCASGETCADGRCIAVGACENFTSTGCYWMENESGHECWVHSPYGFPSDVATCKSLDSCGGGGGGSHGGCYRWADCSLCSTIYPPWP